MNKYAMLMLSLLMTSTVYAEQPQNGQVQSSTSGQQAWDEAEQQWISLDQFWHNYAKQRGGLTWGSSEEYPPYEQVKEGDMFLAIVPSGTCLMEFFHQRWRRANDVRRWHEQFNHYSGCPRVFD